MSSMMRNKFDKTPEEARPYNTTHQLVSLVGINLQQKTITGFVELTIIPKKPNLRKVKVNVKQCRIYKILVNDKFEAVFHYYDLLLNITPTDSTGNQYSLEQFAGDHRDAVLESDPDAGGGEVLVILPVEASHLIAEGRPFRLSIEYSLENPQGGMYFFIPENEGTQERAHMFTTRNENNSRLWFPCIDSYSEVCTWKLEFTVDENLTAVSCGDLVEIIQTSDGSRKKTFHYFLSVPTAAPNIGVAVGPFEIYVDPNMHEVVHFCLPGLMNLLRWTSRFLYEVFEFYEESLACRFPYSCFKNVYCNETYQEMTSYASLCILDMNLLHTSAIVDQTYVTRRFSALSIAEQFYSCFISMQHSSDAWLSKGISNYLCGLYLKKFFGNNDYRHWIYSELQDVIKYEQQHGGIILDPSMLGSNPGSGFKSSGGMGIGLNTNSNSSSNMRPPTTNQHQGGDGGHYFSLQNPQTVSPTYMEYYAKKSHLIIRMLEHRIGNQLLLQVLNKQLSLATIYITQTQQLGMSLASPAQLAAANPGGPPPPSSSGPGTNPTNPMLISTTSFTRAIFTVTGKDMTVFMDQWVRQGGHVRFHMSFIFNRKRNTVELDLKQECLQQLGVRKYVGPLTVALQELDGTFKHVLQIEGTHAKADIVCHSKSRRQKKKKIPLCTGEEVDMDLTTMDADSPVLWIRLDPEMTLIRAVDTRQPDFQWQYQLRHERDVTAQVEAITALETYPTPQTRMALTDVIENEQSYYKVRCQACHCLAKVANAMVSSWSGPPAMLNIFRKLFGSFSCPQIVKPNDFSNLQHYFIQKAILVAMATLRNIHGICPAEVLKFLLDLLKYNDNSKNRLSDNYYRAAIVNALGNTVTPVVSYSQVGSDITAESLSSDTRLIMEEITRCLNLEKMLHSYKFTVTVDCLRVLRKLQKFSHIPNNVEIFKTYAVPTQFYDVRMAALEALVDYTITDGNLSDAEYVLGFLDSDPVPLMKHELCQLMVRLLSEKQAEKRKSKTPFHHQKIAMKLWRRFNYESSVDARVRCSLVDLYFTLFGSRKPFCLMDEDQQVLMDMITTNAETTSRRKSPLTTREGLEEFKKEPEEIVDADLSKATSAKVLSSKRESMASDNSGELPEAMDTSLPTSFEPGMFKASSAKEESERERDKEKDKEKEKEKDHQVKEKDRDKDKDKDRDRDPDRDRDREDKDKESSKDMGSKDAKDVKEKESDGSKEKDRDKDKAVGKVREREEDDDKDEPPHKKHHHHHHNKAKKKKEKKKKHKHKHKHRHNTDHKKPKTPKEETLSSGSSGSNSPAPANS